MLKIFKFSTISTAHPGIFRVFKSNSKLIDSKTFLTHAYNCKEVWEDRCKDLLIKNVKLEELYQELDQRYQRTQQMSAVDVDIFANAIKEETYIDELLDLVYKLRLSPESRNTLNSTSHAVIRFLNDFNRTDLLLDVLDDRLNYGIFLDNYTANLLMDKFWKQKDFVSGARVASQMMLQEELTHPLTRSLAVLHCYNYLLRSGNWPKLPKIEEPEEEVKVRVRFLRNPYNDNHFDLRDPNKIVGKTLYTSSKNEINELSKSFQIVGLALYDKFEKSSKIIEECTEQNIKVYSEVVNVLSDESEIKKDALKLKQQTLDVQNLLENNIKTAVESTVEKDIAEQCGKYQKWIEERKNALEAQKRRLQTDKRLANVDKILKNIREKEVKLWFFENEEQIELQIQDKHLKQQENVTVTKTSKIEEDYIPPEISVKHS